MQSQPSKNNMQAFEEYIGVHYKGPSDSGSDIEMKLHPEVHAVIDIVSGLCASLKKVQNYRLFMHEEIKDILKRQVFTKED